MASVVEFERETGNEWRDASTIRVALAGCGAVGSALLRELVARRATLADRHGVGVTLTRVLVRDVARERNAPFDRSLLTSDVEEFLGSDADVVIEAIGGTDTARQVAVRTLSSGRELVTANKELLALYGSELAALARRNRTTLRYDAAVGGGVPVLRLLDDALGAGTPSTVRGILNGTSNFVLTRLEEGASLDDALASARAAGFAEADASRDLDGRDAAAKLALVAWAAFGVAPESLTVRRSTLLPDPARHVRLAERLGLVVRQLAECRSDDDAVVATVEPVLLDAGSAFARTRDEQNRVEVHAGWSAPLCASGPGAGGVPTATALLSDLLADGRGRSRATRLAVATSDTRRSAWAIEVLGAPALLHRLAFRSGCVHTDARATCAWSVIDAATPVEVDTVLAALNAEGARPIAVRLDEGVANGGRPA
jgi:homoserine dehydrogenase